MSGLELVVGGAATVIVAVFVVALRYVTRRARAPGDVPAATIVDGGARWREGQGRARFVTTAEAFHRVAVAAALTGIIVMVVCVVGVVVLGVASVVR